MNGVTSKSDLQAVSALINNSRFPYVNDAVLTDITVFVDNNIVHARYELPNGAVYSFTYSGEEKLEAQSAALGVDKADKTWNRLSISDANLNVYQQKQTAKPNDVGNVYPYLITTSDYIVSLRIFNIDPDEIEDYIKNISFGIT